LLYGETLMELNRPRDAEGPLGLAIKLGRPSAHAYRARGLARVMQNKHEEAVDDYARAIELAPDAATHVSRGFAYLVVEAPKMALRDFEQALRLDPKSASAYAGRGFVRAVLGDYRTGVADAEKALERGASPSLIYHAARVYAQAVARAPSRAAVRTRYQDRAVKLLEQAVEKQPLGKRAGFWKSTVLRDTALNPIRDAGGYRRLVRLYGSGR
jgi:tetratricopeptide (TPR) repeat protein